MGHQPGIPADVLVPATVYGPLPALYRIRLWPSQTESPISSGSTMAILAMASGSLALRRTVPIAVMSDSWRFSVVGQDTLGLVMVAGLYRRSPCQRGQLLQFRLNGDAVQNHERAEIEAAPSVAIPTTCNIPLPPLARPFE